MKCTQTFIKNETEEASLKASHPQPWHGYPSFLFSEKLSFRLHLQLNRFAASTAQFYYNVTADFLEILLFQKQRESVYLSEKETPYVDIVEHFRIFPSKTVQASRNVWL